MANKTSQPDDRTQQYVKQWDTWKEELNKYWPEIDKNQQMYEFYKSEQNETSSDVSLNTPFSIVESMVAKANDSTISVTVKAKGTNDLQDFEEYISGVTKAAIEDPDVATYVGSFRKTREMHLREMLVKGNAVSEVNYLYKTGIVNGGKRVLADNPATQVLPFKSLIFNPSGYMDQSDVYYVEKHVKFSSLKDDEYKEEEELAPDGTKTTKSRGKYTNLGELKKMLDKDGALVDDKDMHNYAMDKKVPRKVEPVFLLERWDGAKLCVIAVNGSKDGGIIIREEYDPLKTGRHGLLISMNYKVEGRPYAYGEIDAIYKPVRAQDTVLNQSIEMVNKYLRPSILVSDYEADLDQIIEVMEMGGVAYGNAQGITNIPTNIPPPAAFQTLDSLQQAIERTARYSPYATGQTSQQTDKTAGTASGINAIQEAAEPNFTIKLDCLNDTFMNPLGRLYLPMIANLMGENELRYSILRGAKTEWVKATKGILQGKARIMDLMTIGLLKQEEVVDFLVEMGLEPQNPASVEQTVVFDVDWLVDVALDNKSAADKEREVAKTAAWINTSAQLGQRFHPKRVSLRMGKDQGIEDPEELFMTEEELQQERAATEQAQQQEMQQQQMMQQEQMQAQMQQKQMDIEAEREKMEMQAEQALMQEKIRGINQVEVATRRQPVGAR